jgi:hypothetical protein
MLKFHCEDKVWVTLPPDHERLLSGTILFGDFWAGNNKDDCQVGIELSDGTVIISTIKHITHRS